MTAAQQIAPAATRTAPAGAACSQPKCAIQTWRDALEAERAAREAFNAVDRAYVAGKLDCKSSEYLAAEDDYLAKVSAQEAAWTAFVRGAVSEADAACPVAPLTSAVEDLLRAELEAPSADEATDAADARDQLSDRIAGLKATSVNGAVLQLLLATERAELVRGCSTQEDRDHQHEVFENLMRSALTVLAGRISATAWEGYVGGPHPYEANPPLLLIGDDVSHSDDAELYAALAGHKAASAALDAAVEAEAQADKQVDESWPTELTIRAGDWHVGRRDGRSTFIESEVEAWRASLERGDYGLVGDLRERYEIRGREVIKAWDERAARIDRELRDLRLPELEEASEAAATALQQATQAVFSAPVRTPDGLRAKLAFVRRELRQKGDEETPAERMLKALLQDAVGLTGIEGDDAERVAA